MLSPVDAGTCDSKAMIGNWTCRHFAQANPQEEGQDDVPALLRRVADSIESLGEVSVHDVTFHTEVTAEGSWHSMSVYFSEGDIYEDGSLDDTD